MLILALDCCGSAVSVACLDVAAGDAHSPGRTLGHAFLATATGQASVLAPQIRQVMEEAGVGFPALDRLAVTVGPGSFTGLRIGLATARGLALASAKPLFGITAFAAVAAGVAAAPGRAVLVALDSRRDDLFVQLFRSGAPASAPASCAPAGLEVWLADRGVTAACDLVVAGDGAPAARVGSGLDLRSEPGTGPIDARIVARLAARLNVQDRWDAPVYLRAPDATPSSPNTPGEEPSGAKSATGPFG